MKKIKKFVTFLCIFISWFLFFVMGEKTALLSQKKETTDEMHFINHNYIRNSDPTFQSFLLKNLRDSLRKIDPPYNEDALNKLINSIEKKTRLKNYIVLDGVDSTNFKFIVGENKVNEWKSGFF